MTNRNYALRQTDWRFLLPAPSCGAFQHLLLVGGDTRLAETILEQGIARQVSCEVRAGCRADAAVILHSAHSLLERAAECLQADGVLYCAAHSASVIQRVRAAGLQPLDVYCVMPNFEQAEAYVPVEPRSIADWYISALDASDAFRRRLKLAWQCVSPVQNLAITAMKGAREHTRLSVLGHANMPAELQQSDVHSVLVTGGDALNRVAIFPFAPGAAQPSAVLKFSRVAERNHATRREQIALRHIRKCLDAELRTTLPEPRGLMDWNGLAVGLENCARGHSMNMLVERHGGNTNMQIENLHLVGNWLCRFHQQARVLGTGWNEKQCLRWVEQPRYRYQEMFGAHSEQEAFLCELVTRARELMGTPLPMVWAHWGLDMRNLFREHAHVTVIDWEGGSMGLPLIDLVYLCTQWYMRAHRVRSEDDAVRAFQDLYFASRTPNALAGAMRQEIARYVRAVGIAPPFIPILIAQLWILRALGRVTRQNQMAPTPARAGNLYTRYVETLARRRAAFFAQTFAS